MPRLETDLGPYIYSPFSAKKLFNGRACFNSFPRFKFFDRLLQYFMTEYKGRRKEKQKRKKITTKQKGRTKKKYFMRSSNL